jgi:ABC-type antimicrobial peptide transport system permease subunit
VRRLSDEPQHVALDALTFAAAAAALTAVGILAACVPAARAAQIDPVIALRE